MRHADYADASIVRADSEVVFLAGACPLDENGAVVAPGDVAAQTRKALENMDAVLGYPEQLVEIEPVAARTPH